MKAEAGGRFKKTLIDKWIEEKSVKRNQNEKETH